MRRVHPIRGAPEKIEFLEKTTDVSCKNYEVVFLLLLVDSLEVERLLFLLFYKKNMFNLCSNCDI